MFLSKIIICTFVLPLYFWQSSLSECELLISTPYSHKNNFKNQEHNTPCELVLKFCRYFARYGIAGCSF